MASQQERSRGGPRQAGARQRFASTTSGARLVTAPLLGAGSLLLVRAALGRTARTRIHGPRDRGSARGSARDRGRRDGRSRRPGRARALARAGSRDRGQHARDGGCRRRRAGEHPAPAARQCPHPRRSGSRRARQRTRGTRGGRAGADPRDCRCLALRRLRASYSSSLNCADRPRGPNAARAARRRRGPRRRPRPRATRRALPQGLRERLALGEQPQASDACTEPSTPASGTASGERRASTRTARPPDHGRWRARRRDPPRVPRPGRTTRSPARRPRDSARSRPSRRCLGRARTDRTRA